MAEFTVTSIVDGYTFDVSPRWAFQGKTGSRVRPAEAPEMDTKAGQSAKDYLSTLILNKKVEIDSAKLIDRDRLVCEVFFNGENLGRNLASRFGK